MVGRGDRRRARFAPKVEGLEGRSLLSVLTVTSEADSGAGSLRATIAGAASGDVINFAPALDGGTITLTGGEIALPDGVTVQGPGADVLTISANDQSRIFHVTPSDEGGTVAISGLSLDNASALNGAAIDDPDPNGTLMVNDCTFVNNLAVGQGGAIASDARLTVVRSTFSGDRVIGLNGLTDLDTSSPAIGGAIYADGNGLGVSNSRFDDNQAWGGDGALGGFAGGGAVAWMYDTYNDQASGVGIAITGNTFDANSALAGSSSRSPVGVRAEGGAVMIDASNTTLLSANVSNNTFSNNTAIGGAGYRGGLAVGGGFAFDGSVVTTPKVVADDDRFENGGAFGGACNDGSVDSIGRGGDAYGGGLAVLQSPTVTLDRDTVSGAVARGGQAEIGANGSILYGRGGNAQGGGIYVDANDTVNGAFNIESATLSADSAIGGNGGCAGLNAGDASGGGLAMSISAGGVTSNPTFTIERSQVIHCTATGGVGESGLPGVDSSGNGGGPGGNSYGGGAALDPGDSYGAIYHVTNDTFFDDKANGGVGGDGGSSSHGLGLKGGNGGKGGEAVGGGLAMIFGLDGFGHEGQGRAKALQMSVANTKFLNDQAKGGNGGQGGNGNSGGNGGNAGIAAGGAVSLQGHLGDPSNQVTFDADFLFASLAQGGSGGLGGTGITAAGGQGGSGEGGFGGGLDVVFRGLVRLQDTTILGNQAAGGKGGLGGSGLGVTGKKGANGLGEGGGVRNAGVPGGTVVRTADTLILVNVADIDPDVHGPIGNI